MFKELSVQQIALQYMLGKEKQKKKRQRSGVLLESLDSRCSCEMRMLAQFRCWEGLPKCCGQILPLLQTQPVTWRKALFPSGRQGPGQE